MELRQEVLDGAEILEVYSPLSWVRVEAMKNSTARSVISWVLQ